MKASWLAAHGFSGIERTSYAVACGYGAAWHVAYPRACQHPCSIARSRTPRPFRFAGYFPLFDYLPLGFAHSRQSPRSPGRSW